MLTPYCLPPFSEAVSRVGGGFEFEHMIEISECTCLEKLLKVLVLSWGLLGKRG